MKNYEWKQRTYSNAHLVNDENKSLCRRTKVGGKWLKARPELEKCGDCLREAERQSIEPSDLQRGA
jgi:ribonuclease HI